MAGSRLAFSLWLVGWASTALAQHQGEPNAEETAQSTGAGTDVSNDEEFAQAHFRTGRSYFDRGRYEEALVEFQRAFERSGRVELQYNIYLSQERLGHLPEAIEALERYLEEGGHDQPQLRDRLEAMRQRLAVQTAEAAERAAAENDDETQEEGVPAQTPVAEDSGVSIPAVVSFVVAGVGLVTFGVLGALALAEDSSLASDCNTEVAPQCSDDELSALNGMTLGADIGLGVAAAGALTGLVLLLVDGGTAAEPEAVAIQISPTYTGLHVGF